MKTCQTNRRKHWVWIAAALLLLMSACTSSDAEPTTAPESTAAAADEATTTSTTTTVAPTTTTEDPCASIPPTTVPSEPEPVGPAKPLASPTAVAVADRGTVVVGVTSRDDKLTSFESLLVDEVVDRMFGDVLIERVPLSAAERWIGLQSVDFMIRNSTATTSRAENGLFTGAYFVDGFVIASRAGEPVDLPCFAGTLARLGGTTFAQAGEKQLRAISSEDFEIIDAEVTPDMIDLIDSGEADLAIFFTGSYLENAQSYDIELVGAIEPINAWVFEDAAFRDELDRTLAEIIADGTWEDFYVDTFGEDPYFTTGQMRSAPIPDR